MGSLRQHEALELAERLLEQRLLLLDVQVRVAHRRRGRRRAPGVAELAAFAHVLVDLVLDAQMGFVFTAGKVRGTLTMPDGTVFKADTPENYQAIKDELREKLLQQEPGAIILKETAEK